MSRETRGVLLCLSFGLLAWDLGVGVLGLISAVVGVAFGVDAFLETGRKPKE